MQPAPGFEWDMKTRPISAESTKSYSALRLNVISPSCAATLNSRSSIPKALGRRSWHWCLNTHWLTRDQAFAFLNCDELIGSHVGYSILAAAGPGYFDTGNLVGFAQAESQRELALGAVAGAAAYHVMKLGAACELYRDPGSDCVPVRYR